MGKESGSGDKPDTINLGDEGGGGVSRGGGEDYCAGGVVGWQEI